MSRIPPFFRFFMREPGVTSPASHSIQKARSFLGSGVGRSIRKGYRRLTDMEIHAIERGLVARWVAVAFRDFLRLFTNSLRGSAAPDTNRSVPLPTHSLIGEPGTTGPPKSSNGASSMHLFWQMPAPDRNDPLVEALATITVLKSPTINRLFFWALQVSFIEGGKTIGAGHFGLQHHPSYPSGGAVNWGGYHGAGSTGSGELPGSALHIPSTLNNPNTGDYLWQAGRRYQYRIRRSDQSNLGWIGSVTDLETGVETIVRELQCPGSELGEIMVWTEAFAHCDEAGVSVQWGDLRAVTASGVAVRPTALRVNYQTVGDGGCITSNAEVVMDDSGNRLVEQQTGTVRTTPSGSQLIL